MKLKDLTSADVNAGARGNPRSKRRRNPERTVAKTVEMTAAERASVEGRPERLYFKPSAVSSTYKRPAAVQARADEKKRAAVYKRPEAVKARIAAGSAKALRDRWEEAEEIERLRREAQGKGGPGLGGWMMLATVVVGTGLLVAFTRPTA